MQGSPIILVNRTSYPLDFTADSRFYTLAPGENYGYVQGHAQFATAQNPLMGSEDYYSLEFQSLVGIKGQTDCAPIPDDVLLAAVESHERFDRKEAGLAPVKFVKPRHRMPVGRSGGVVTQANDNALAVGSA